MLCCTGARIPGHVYATAHCLVYTPYILPPFLFWMICSLASMWRGRCLAKSHDLVGWITAQPHSPEYVADRFGWLSVAGTYRMMGIEPPNLDAE